MKKCVVFTDIKSSSILWGKHKNKMLTALQKHDQQIRSVVNKLKGLVVKTIGDSYMIIFSSLMDGINFGIEMSKKQKQTKIMLDREDQLLIRIGMCYGEVNQKKINVQNVNLIDYFGATVNIASRMESKVSAVGGFAFCARDSTKVKLPDTVIFDVIHYKNKCDGAFKRSGRLLLPETCRSSEELKGVGELTAYKCYVVEN